MKLAKSKFTWVALTVLICGMLAVGLFRYATPGAAHAAKASSAHSHIDCSSGRPICTEVADSEQAFGQGHYVGHDEPSTLFYSNKPGSGNQMSYNMTLPKDPSASSPTTKSYNFELHPAFWFGMALCDTQSYPELVPTCTPNSDKNIVDPVVSPNHPGTAFMEMQFYPPGFAPWPAGNSCDATKWCAALNIDSYSLNPVTGKPNNAACLAVAGIEPVNFAFITLSGKSQAPANPVDATLATFTPDPAKDLFMNSGDNIIVRMHDTANGLQIVLDDKTTSQSGSMTTSIANGFAQVKYDPTAATCTAIPYDFHPMYSTSSEKTRVPWAAHSYNVAFADEIGHFDYCSNVTSTGTCDPTATEGIGANAEPSDPTVDDVGCFPASASTLVQVSGCIGTNTGFDGVPYQPVWPDGNTLKHPTAIKFTSPHFGPSYNQAYSRFSFETDLPRIEDPGASPSNNCNRSTGAGCLLIPMTDDGNPAAFYPFFSTTNWNGHCVWQLGNHIPGSTNDFHQNAQYGTLLNSTYTGTGGIVITRYNNFRQVFSSNPCA